MLDVHPPHSPTHTWKDFFIHLATIVIGLLIAVGLEQAVEYLHHRHLVREFEVQMNEEFVNDRKILENDLEIQSAYRLYLTDLQTAINAKLEDRPFTMPTRNDPRNVYELNIPQLSAYYVAEKNGTLSFLDNKKLGIFNKIARQHDVLLENFTAYRAAEFANQSFRFQYEPRPEPITTFKETPGYVDVSILSKPELLHYREIIANLMVQVDSMTWRFKYMNRLVQLVQDGVSDDVEISRQVHERLSTTEQK